MPIYKWIGASGNWSDVADWSPANVPGASDSVIFDEDSAAYDVTTGTASARYITLNSSNITLEDNGDLTCAALSLVEGALTIDSDASFTGRVGLSGGILNVAGTIANSEVVFNGGSLYLETGATLSNDVFLGVFNVSNTGPIYVSGSFTVDDRTGNKPGVLNIVDDQLDFDNDEFLNLMTINLGSAASGQGGHLGLAPTGDAAITLTLGDGVIVNSYGQTDSLNVAPGDNASNITNDGAIHQLGLKGSFSVLLDSGAFTNNGSIDSYAGGTIIIDSLSMSNLGVLSVGGGSSLDTSVDVLTINMNSRINIGANSTWKMSGETKTPVVRNYGVIALAGGVISNVNVDSDLFNTTSGTIIGFGTITQPVLYNDGRIEASGKGLALHTTIYGGGVFKVDARATVVLWNNVLEGVIIVKAGGKVGITNHRSLFLTYYDSEENLATVAGSISGAGTFVIGVSAAATFTNGATDAGGGVVNKGIFYVGASTQTAPVKVSVVSIENIGKIDVTGSANAQALLEMGGAAGFGTLGVLTGYVFLSGDSAISFTSGGFNSIGSSGFLEMDGSDAYLELAAATGSNSALNTLTENSGFLSFDDGADFVAQLAFSNSLSVMIDAQKGHGGSVFTALAGFTNFRSVTIGYYSISADSELSTTTFTNEDYVDLEGGSAAKAYLSASSGVVNNGNFRVNGSAEVLGAVSGAGRFNLGTDATLTFDSAVGLGQTVVFGEGDVLALKESSFGGRINLFGKSDSDAIDLLSLAPDGASLNFVPNTHASGGVLTLSSGDQSFKLSLIGQYDDADFSLAADAGTGTLVKYV